MKKRGISPVIASVLIILITVITASLIAVFVIPFVQKNLNEGKECFDVLGQLEFAQTPYNCNYINSTLNRAAFSVRLEGDKMIGFNIILGKDGTANTFKIMDNVNHSNIGLLNSSFGEPLQVPRDGGVRTYVANDAYTSADLYPILANGDVCDKADTIIITSCSDPVVRQNLQNYV